MAAQGAKKRFALDSNLLIDLAGEEGFIRMHLLGLK
jgi:hypothetical protein